MSNELKAHTLFTTSSLSGQRVYLKSAADAVIAHANYKRCKAMAKYCELREDEFGGDFAKRWFKKWLDLADKFKEVK